MEQLMREMETSSTSRTDFETLVKQMSAATAPAASSVPGASGTSTGGQVSFSETLSRTMERMQESETQADSARMEDLPENSETDAFLAEMLKQLDAAGGGEGLGGEMGMAKMLEGMMEQLMSKEILYEPMKDLNDKVGALFLCFCSESRWLRGLLCCFCCVLGCGVGMDRPDRSIPRG
jgi:peroxin-19